MKRLLWLIIFHAHTALSMDIYPAKPSVIEVAPSAGHYCERSLLADSPVIDTLVMHYTATTLKATLKIFSSDKTPVASHYIIDEDGTIFSNIPEEFAARHAGRHIGDSSWNGATMVNANSLGIEHVNFGYRVNETQEHGIKIEGDDLEWYPFERAQINASIALSAYLVAKYHIQPENIVGHSDVAPKRKQDPGPLFPWRKLAENGVGAWQNFESSGNLDCFEKAIKENTLENWLINHLHIWGYKLPDEKSTAQDIIRAFQMHFRQNNISGIADLETAHILNALICNYKTTHGHCPCGH